MEVFLVHKQEFVEALDSYHPSDEAVRLIASMPLVILLGATRSGRNTIIEELERTGRYYFIVSDTTRPPKLRDGEMEQDGVRYHFRSEDEVLAGVRAGDYLEVELIHDQQVSGTSIRELIRAHESGKVPINEVDLGGTDAIAAAKPDALFVFVIPPSYEEWMRRLRTRETMSDEELANRMTTAAHIFRRVLSSDRFVFVVNDMLDQVVSTIDDYVNGVRHDLHDTAARAVAHRIYEELMQQYPALREELL